MKHYFYSLLAIVAFLAVSPSAFAQGLKDTYKDYFLIGVAVNQRNVTNAEQAELVKREFSSITCENDMKPEPTEPQEGKFNWEAADRIANFCRANGIKLRGHCLMWHSQIGRWMFSDNPSKEVFFQRMRNHIHAVVNRYKDVVYAWDVVNEAMTDDPKAEFTKMHKGDAIIAHILNKLEKKIWRIKWQIKIFQLI